MAACSFCALASRCPSSWRKKGLSFGMESAQYSLVSSNNSSTSSHACLSSGGTCQSEFFSPGTKPTATSRCAASASMGVHCH